MISIIVAVSEDYGIGAGNDLLWKIPEDLRRFKTLTTGNCIIMGKRTWLSLPKRPLPGRYNIVLTDIQSETIEGSTTAYSVEDALAKCPPGKEIYIIGGGSVYRQFMPYADRLLITHVHSKAPADTWFPIIDDKEWILSEKEEHRGVENEYPPYAYAIYHRRKM